jgi:hypothetical protein
MTLKSTQPEWHKLSECLDRFPVKMTEEQLKEYLFKLKIIKNRYDLGFKIDNEDVKTTYQLWGDLDFYIPQISESCIQKIITHINKEIEQYFILDTLENLIELNEQGLVTTEVIQDYKSHHKLL